MLRQTRRLIGLVIQLNTEQGTVWSPGCICISMGHLALTEHSPPMSSPACLPSLHRYISIWPHCVCSPLLLLFHFCWWCAPCHGPRSLQWPLLCSARAGHRSAAPFTPLIWLPWKQWVLTAQHWREQSLHRLPFHVGLGVFVTLHPAQVAQKSTKLPCYWIDLSVCSIFNIFQPPVICLCHSQPTIDYCKQSVDDNDHLHHNRRRKQYSHFKPWSHLKALPATTTHQSLRLSSVPRTTINYQHQIPFFAVRWGRCWLFLTLTWQHILFDCFDLLQGLALLGFSSLWTVVVVNDCAEVAAATQMCVCVW